MGAPRVLLGMPSYDGKYTREMTLSREEMLGQAARQGIEIGWTRSLGSVLPRMRHETAVLAVKQNFTHLLFIDADMVFPPHGLTRLLNREVDIVSGMYFKKTPPYSPLAARCGEDGKPHCIQEWPDDELLDDLDRLGTGFLLISTKVLKEMKHPYFLNYWDKWDEVSGEDWYFTKKARDMGYKLHLDTGLQLGHVGPYVYTQHAFKLYRKMSERMEHAELGVAGVAPAPPAGGDAYVPGEAPTIETVTPEIEIVRN